MSYKTRALCTKMGQSGPRRRYRNERAGNRVQGFRNSKTIAVRARRTGGPADLVPIAGTGRSPDFQRRRYRGYFLQRCASFAMLAHHLDTSHEFAERLRPFVCWTPFCFRHSLSSPCRPRMKAQGDFTSRLAPVVAPRVLPCAPIDWDHRAPRSAPVPQF